MDDLGRYEDVLGQLTRLKAYNHMCLCFPLPESTSASQESIIEALQGASIKLTTALPWLRGRVINRGSGAGSSGLFSVSPCPSYEPPNTIIIVKEYSEILPSYEQLMTAKAPAFLMNGDMIAPRKGFPQGYEESDEELAIVLFIQANFIKNGLLLNFAAQHNIMDGGGLFQSMNLLACAMRGEEFPESAVEHANADRRNLFPLVEDNVPMPDFSHLRMPLSSKMPPIPKDRFKWVHFRFSSAKQSQLKQLATKVEDFVDTVEFVSTNDVLCAFVWKSIATASVERGQKLDAISKFARAIDGRRALGVPLDYMGVMVANASSWLSFRDLSKRSLAWVASSLRKSLNEASSEHTIRSFATMIANERDKSTIMYGGAFNAGTDIGCSSVAHVAVHKINFGILGSPELVRRPTFATFPRMVYFMPRTSAADVDILACLSEADIEAMKHDPVWKFYTEYIG